MQFINPIELLSLKDTPVQEIDSSVIRKAKRKVLADIELSDTGFIAYNGSQINKSDADNAINELEDKEKIEFFYFIANNKDLNSFLTSGNERLFNAFKQESIYKLPDFISFISPYFTEKYDKSLLIAFQNDDETTFRKIVSVQPLVTSGDKDRAYKSISNAIKERIKEIDELTTEIKNEESVYDKNDIDEVFDFVQEKLNINIINSLPQYFQSLRNQVANCVRNLSVNVFNAFGNSQLALDIIGFALDFEIDGLTKQKLNDDYNQIDEINDRHLEETRQEPILKKYAGLLISIRTKLDEIEKVNTTAYSVNSWASTSISVSDINSLDNSFDEIRNQIAIGLRALSVGVWNKFNDINVALNLINIALNIKTNSVTTDNLTDAKNQLVELKRKIDLMKPTPSYPRTSNNTTRTNATSSSNSNNNQGCLIFIVIAVVIGIIIAIANSNSSSDYKSSTSYSNNNNNDNSNNSYSSSDPTNTKPINSYSEPVVAESKYKGNQLIDGASPLDGCFGKGVYGGNATLTIKNGGSSDAIVCLYSISNGRTIRNEYVRKNSSFTMSKIAQGAYKIRVFYGNDWNPELTNNCGTKGNFETDVYFSEFDGTEYFEDSDRGYTIATITLYTVAGGNASSTAIDQSKFFSN